MKKYLLIPILFVFSSIALEAQQPVSLEQGPLPQELTDTSVQESQLPLRSSESGDSNHKPFGENDNWLAYAGIIIALIFGFFQWLSSYNMYRATKVSNMKSQYLSLLEDFTREIYIQNEEKLCLIKALKKEGTEGKMVDTVFLADDALKRNLRETALQKLCLPKKTIKKSQLEQYMGLNSVPNLEAIDFKYKKH